MSQKFLTGINMMNTPIDGLPDAVSASQPATKGQLDAAIQGLAWKVPVRTLATSNITLSGTQTVATVALNVNDRVLAVAQSNPALNGPWLVQSGPWVRPADFDVSSEAVNAAFLVTEGDAKNNQWRQSTPAPITLGTTALNFVQFGGGGVVYIGANGVIVNGSVISADPAVVARRASATIGDGTATSITFNHGLALANMLDVQVTVRDATTGEEVTVDNKPVSANAVMLTFATAPTNGQYRVFCVG